MSVMAACAMPPPDLDESKMTLLAKRAKGKKRHEKGDALYSSELKCASGHNAEGDRPVPFYHDDSDTSIPSGPQASFLFESPLATKQVTNVGGTPGSAQFSDSPEQRKIINSRSRASGSQSDRHWASKVKKLIPRRMQFLCEPCGAVQYHSRSVLPVVSSGSSD